MRKRPQEDLQKIAVGDDLEPVLEGELLDDALVLPPIVEREQHRHAYRDED